VSDTSESLRRKIGTATDLQSVVRTMKAIAASSIGQYEGAVRALDDYYRTVELSLRACLGATQAGRSQGAAAHTGKGATGVIVFGSDQGLVGKFNEVMLDFVVQQLASLPGEKIIWAVGERIQSRLNDTELPKGKPFALPNAIGAITPLVGQILGEVERLRETGDISQVYVFHQRPQSGAIYTPVFQRLLPLDQAWRQALSSITWPSINLPEVMHAGEPTLRAFVREYLFVSLFRACAESLASENASRLAAMQRAEKNITDLLEELNRSFHRQRQSGIDEELFDLVAGFEALKH
jgi:F-type H+-transporting ATPase subunit gamma